MHAFFLSSPQPHISFVRPPFSFFLWNPLLNERWLMEMAFVPVNLYIRSGIVLSKIGRWSVLSPLPWFMHSSFHLRRIDVPRPPRAEGFSVLFPFWLSISLFIFFYILVVEAPLTTTPGGNKFSVSFAAFIPACSLPHTPCILHGCPSISPSLMAEGEPCSRLDRTGAPPELEQAFKI